jgi:hypothetical protein
LAIGEALYDGGFDAIDHRQAGFPAEGLEEIAQASR